MLHKFLITRRTRREIMARYAVDEREARRGAARVANDYALVSLSDADKPGYKIATSRADYEDVKRAFSEDLSRIRKINARQKQRRIFMRLVESGATDVELRNHYKIEEEI